MTLDINQEQILKRVLEFENKSLSMIETSAQENFKKILKNRKKVNIEKEHFNIYTKDNNHYIVTYRFKIKDFSILQKEIYIEYLYYKDIPNPNVYLIGEELY